MTDIDELMERLRAAELVCNTFAACGSRGNSDREDAATQAWMDWARDYEFAMLRVPDETIAELAARRRAIRAATLAKIRQYIEPEA